MLDINLIRDQFNHLNMDKTKNNVEVDKSFVKICNNIAVRPIEFLNLAKNIIDTAWKKRFVELIGLEALLEVSQCFSEYVSIATSGFPNDMSSGVLEYSYTNSPRWIALRLSQALFHAIFITLQQTPFVKLLIEFIDETIGRKLFLTYPTPSRDFSEELPETIIVATVGSDLDAIVEIIMSEVYVETRYRYFHLSTLLVQDSIFEDFNKKLIVKCEQALKQSKMRPSDEVGMKDVVEQCIAFGAKTKSFYNDIIQGAVIYDVKPMDWNKELPIISVLSFRTTNEALKLAENLSHFCAAAVWGSDVLSFAKKLKCTTVWINSYGLTHPSITLCPGRNCRYISAKESGVFEEHDDFKVGKGASKNIIPELMRVNKLEPYIKVLQKWLTVENVAVSSQLNVVTNIMDPVGLVMVPWRTKGKDLAVTMMIGALACGNHVRLCVDEDERADADVFMEAILAVLPKGVVELGSLGELYGMHPYGNTVDKRTGWRRNLVIPSEAPETQELLWQFVNTQYLWLQ